MFSLFCKVLIIWPCNEDEELKTCLGDNHCSLYTYSGVVERSTQRRDLCYSQDYHWKVKVNIPTNVASTAGKLQNYYNFVLLFRYTIVVVFLCVLFFFHDFFHSGSQLHLLHSMLYQYLCIEHHDAKGPHTFALLSPSDLDFNMLMVACYSVLYLQRSSVITLGYRIRLVMQCFLAGFLCGLENCIECQRS